jgi:ABC-type multidrug transport system ATPase subunit
MTISLSEAGKRFNREWIFRNFTRQFQGGKSYAIIGPNGSGKSTLLQVLGGSLMLSEGKIEYRTGEKMMDAEEVFRQVSLCAPYLEVLEEMTLVEFLVFHQKFKPFINSIHTDKAIELIGLSHARDKQIRYYSSGMKQRVKLAQCIFSDTAIVLLDEPCTNLDSRGIDLYHQLLTDYCAPRLVVIASNDEVEWKGCDETILMR